MIFYNNTDAKSLHGKTLDTAAKSMAIGQDDFNLNSSRPETLKDSPDSPEPPEDCSRLGPGNRRGWWRK